MSSSSDNNTDNTSAIYGALAANAVYGGFFYILFEICKTQRAIFSPRKMSKTLKTLSRPASGSRDQGKT